MTVNDRARQPSFITMNFNYLIEDGFRTVDVERSSDGKSWSITLDGKCRIRIQWNWHDGVDILASKSENSDYKTPKGYVIEILIYYLMGKEIIEQYYDDKHGDNHLENIAVYSQFLQTHLDKIVEFVSSDRDEQEKFELQQARKALIELQRQRITEKR